MLPNPKELYLYQYTCMYKNCVKQFPYNQVCVKIGLHEKVLAEIY